MVARLPAIIASVFMGNALRQNQWPLFILLAVAASVLFILGVVYHNQLQEWLWKILKRNKNSSSPDEEDDATETD